MPAAIFFFSLSLYRPQKTILNRLQRVKANSLNKNLVEAQSGTENWMLAIFFLLNRLFIRLHWYGAKMMAKD